MTSCAAFSAGHVTTSQGASFAGLPSFIAAASMSTAGHMVVTEAGRISCYPAPDVIFG